MKVENLVIPGRHHLLTNYQHEYLKTVMESGQVQDVQGQPLEIATNPNLIFAVTSANHSNTRRNPIPGNKRELMAELFAEDLPAQSFTYPINDLGQTPRFADFVLKEIAVQSNNQFQISPENTAIVCSTPAVIDMYEGIGYRVLPAELAARQPELYLNLRPWDIVTAIAKAGDRWEEDPIYQQEVHSAVKRLYDKYRLGELIVSVFNDPLLSDEGDITNTRDYESYRRAFEQGIERKYMLAKPYIQNGRIVDIGCATGEIIKFMSEDDRLAESDLYGIEASRKLFSICDQRRQNGEFGNDNVFFYHRNIMTEQIFPANSVNTTMTFSLTHEIESYLGRESLQEFLRRVYEQTASGGVYINSDVVGPAEKNKTVFMRLNAEDGVTESWEEIAASPKVDAENLAKLSTLGRFRRFALDFRAEEAELISFKEAEDGIIELSLADACEFLSKKDYLASWYSEMHETFCFWSFDDWVEALTAVGFKINQASHAYRNEWIIKNRYEGKAELFEPGENGQLVPIDFPQTNVLLVAEKSN